jgi:hypothetical protein
MFCPDVVVVAVDRYLTSTDMSLWGSFCSGMWTYFYENVYISIYVGVVYIFILQCINVVRVCSHGGM